MHVYEDGSYMRVHLYGHCLNLERKHNNNGIGGSNAYYKRKYIKIYLLVLVKCRETCELVDSQGSSM